MGTSKGTGCTSSLCRDLDVLGFNQQQKSNCIARSRPNSARAVEGVQSFALSQLMNRSSGLFLFFESLWTFLLTGHVSLRASFFEGIALTNFIGRVLFHDGHQRFC